MVAASAKIWRRVRYRPIESSPSDCCRIFAILGINCEDRIIPLIVIRYNGWMQILDRKMQSDVS